MFGYNKVEHLEGKVSELKVAVDRRDDKIAMYEAAIRKHRDQRGDDRCWLDNEELYKNLPEGYTPPARDELVEIGNCIKFINCQRNPKTVYVSPQRRIEELERELSALRTNYIVMVERCGAQSHLITRLIESSRMPMDPDLIESCRQFMLGLAKDTEDQIARMVDEGSPVTKRSE